MQVESKYIPLICSSFSKTYKITSFVFIIRSTQASPKINFGQVQELKNSIVIVMALNVDKTLATTVHIAPHITSQSNNLNSAVECMNSQQHKLSTLNKLTTFQDEEVDNPTDDSGLDQARTASDESNKFEDSKQPLAVNSTNSKIMLLVDSLDKKEAQKLSTYNTDSYLAPEQALVTSVELVVPASASLMSSSDECKPDDVSDLSSSEIGTKGHHAGELYASRGSCDSTRIFTNDKNDGCANNSSNLDVRITNNVPSSNILLPDRRASIWTPHNEQSRQINIGSSTEEPLTVNSNHLYQQQNRHSNQIEKERCETTGFPQGHPMPLNIHGTAIQRQYMSAEVHPIIEGQSHINFYAQMMQQHHSQNHRQHQSNEVLPSNTSRNQHSTYAIYDPHYQNSTMFANQQNNHQQIQNVLTHHNLSCHSAIDQSDTLSHPQQIQHTQPQIQPHQHQNQQQLQEHHLQPLEQQHHQRQHQIHENYHELIMEDFHEEQSSAFKLTLSPNNVKPENQDDGYETSAGDVLTPSSHSSSTHSVTPQHQMQHLNVKIISQNVQNLNMVNVSNGNQKTVIASQKHFEDVCSGTSNHAPGVDSYSFICQDSHINTVPAVGSANFVPGSVPILASNGSFECRKGEIYEHHDNLLQELGTAQCDMTSKPVPKKRGRKKKLPSVGSGGMMLAKIISHESHNNMCDDVAGDVRTTQTARKERKKHDRFNGMSEEEVIKRTIPDHLCDNLDIVIVGINPGLFAAYKGHHYAGPGNHFWKCLYLAGLTQEQMNADEDHKLLRHGIGFTNMVARATKGSADLTRKEIKEGSRILLEKLQRFRPKVAVFNGKLIFEVFSGKKEFHFGRQPGRVDGTDTYIWVMPSSSARCAQLPRAADKVPFYAALKKFRDFLNGVIPHIDDSECVFTDQRIREQNQTESIEKKKPLLANNQKTVCLTDNGVCSRTSSDCGNAPSGSESQAQFSNAKFIQVKTNIESVSSATTNRSFGTSGDNTMVNNSTSNSAVGDNSYLPVFIQQQPQEKKKRGRPKKIKDQEIIDPTIKKNSLLGQQMQHHDINNILNLSMISGGDSDVVPKKKRGRPKKLKPTIDNLIGVKQIKHPKPNANSKSVCVPSTAVHSIEHVALSPQSNHQMTPSLYNTPPPSHILYTASVSPMASPALNCNYTQVHGHRTPPVGHSSNVAQSTPPIDTQRDQPPLKQTTHQSSLKHGIELREQSNLGDTSPPSSPNICVSADFHATENSESQELPGSQRKVRQQIAHQTGENLPHNSDLHLSHQPDNYQLWSSQSQSHETTQSLRQLSYPQEHSDNWPRYENQNSNPYVVISAHHQHLSPRVANEQQQIHSVSLGTDIARKSLSGLESLVDQIPDIRNHEPSGNSAAAIDSHLVGMQQLSPQQKQHQETSVQEESCIPSNDNRINNSLSITSLVTSVSNSTLENDSSYSGSLQADGNGDTINNNCSNTMEYPIPGSSGYAHHAHLVNTTLGAAINSSEPNQLTHHPHPHPIYMDPTHISNHMSHLPPVNVNSVYGPTAYGSHPQHNTGEYPTAHSHYSLGSPVPGAGPGSTSTLHMPSPNYPYGHHPYSHPPSQANYSNYTHPHSHHNHPAQHISVFDRIKPSDIGGYGGF
ncbi:uncharacterized protein Tdg isoform X1 [Drosophila bipectinata]|uniref:uncharacterized protein Tdg isoform X1 n=2 Tax=Drosophila bipectinata TaxID=42026 RepID=UPI001C898E82|nr:uncharacterized protein LOC108130991 isoform X1 [Drosophila bipectinata]